MKFLSVLLTGLLVLGSAFDAEAARRLGGGGSVGRQSGNVAQRPSSPPAAPNQAPNATQNQAARPAAAPGAAPVAAAAKRPWGAMLGGLATGLGLAWLAHSLGLGAGFGQFLLMALLVLVAVAVAGAVMRARRAGASARGDGTASATGGRPLAFQGAGAPAGTASLPPQYSPDKVGNDASARPWERNSMAFDAGKFAQGTATPQGQPPATGVRIGSALSGGTGWSVPAEFDTEGFTAAAKRNFVTLQDAWDKSDIPALRAMMTDGMLEEIRTQLAERESHIGAQVNQTDVVMLEAKLLGIEDVGDHYVASVEFSGLIREDASAGPSPFREVWNMTKPRNGASGWLVAGVQALQ